MPDQPQQKASGQDLARQALAAYMAGRTPGTPGRTKPPARTRRADRGSGRDPVAFAAVVGRLTNEQGWTTSVAGGSILDQFDTLCPQYVGRVQAVAFDADRGRLDLRPASHAYATQLRMLGGQLCKQINDKQGNTVVRAIRVLPVGTITSRPADVAVEPEDQGETPGPVRTRETASPGYLRNLALHQEHKPISPTESPLVVAARASLDAAIAHPSRREPPAAFTDAVAETERVGLPEQQDAGEAVRQAAIRMARDHKAGGRGISVRRLFDTA